MKGFGSKFRDLPDYILKITYQIWENEDVESIMQYYAENIPVRSPSGVIYGPEAVVKATKLTQQEFPDRLLLGEDVLWIGNEENGFLVDEGDHQRWLEELSKILNDKNLAESMGKHGKKFVQDTFNWDVCAKKFLGILNSNLEK